MGIFTQVIKMLLRLSISCQVIQEQILHLTNDTKDDDDVSW